MVSCSTRQNRNSRGAIASCQQDPIDTQAEAWPTQCRHKQATCHTPSNVGPGATILTPRDMQQRGTTLGKTAPTKETKVSSNKTGMSSTRTAYQHQYEDTHSTSAQAPSSPSPEPPLWSTQTEGYHQTCGST
jgi:hypothetical protein